MHRYSCHPPGAPPGVSHIFPPAGTNTVRPRPMTSKPMDANGDVSAPRLANDFDANAERLKNQKGQSTQHCPLYRLIVRKENEIHQRTSWGLAPPSFSPRPSTPITSRSNGAVAIGICRPSMPTADMALRFTSGESGETPALAAAIQLATLRKEPMSTMAGKGVRICSIGTAPSSDPWGAW